MRVALFSIFCCCMIPWSVLGQMWSGTDTLFGNEWIRFDQTWFKIRVSDDGIYRITYAALNAAGIPLDSVQGARFQLFHVGREVPLYVSSEGLLQTTDFVEFHGVRNRSELDRFLFQNPDEEMLNPYYSLITDTTAYYLSWAPAGTSTLRYQTIPNELDNLPPPDPWYWCELLQVFSNSAVQKTDSEGLAESRFDEGEGFSTGFRSTNIFSFAPKFKANVSENSRFRMKLFSNNRPHELRVSLNGATVHSETFSGYRLQEIEVDKPTGNLSSSEQFTVSGIAGSNDRHAVAWASLSYPRLFNFDNQTIFSFAIEASPQKKLLEIAQFQSGNTPPILYDLTNRTRTTATLSSGMVRIGLPAAAAPRQLILVNPSSGIRAVNTLEKVEFQDFRQEDAEFILIAHPALFQGADGSNPVMDYAAYRSTPAGGSFRTIVVSVEQLYDQFAYGIPQHPLSVRNAVHFFKKYWTNPRFVLLLGKGRQYNVSRTAGSVSGTFMVPTFGAPGSDNLLLSDNQSTIPLFPVGRIAATTPEELRMYLDKVVVHEANPMAQVEADRSWKKEIIHLGGGGSAGEQQFIKNALSQMEGILRQSAVGANVHSWFKTSADPIQQAISEELTRRINEGASILTFFGHSGTGGFDFALDNPSSYRNTRRYPAVFSLGCYSGQIHENLRSIGEQFIFQADKGAIAFFATTGLGYITSLQTLGQSWFSLAGGAFFGKPIGAIAQQVTRQFDQTSNYGLRVLMQQFSLQGDPAITLHPFDQPDILIQRAEAEVMPQPLNTQMDSVTLAFTIRNIGKAVQDSFDLEIIRQFPDGLELSVLRSRLPVPAYAAAYSFRLPLFGARAKGLNRFFVHLDPDNALEEGPLPAAKQNNFLADEQGQMGIEFFVFENSAIPIFPPDEGIAGGSEISLRAGTTDPFAVRQNYHFRLDTTPTFDSPLLLSHTLNSTGGVLSWTPSAQWRDSTVYYWQISPDSIEGIGFQWRTSSFLRLANTVDGWNQSHYFQQSGNRLINMEMDTMSRRLKFLDDLKTIRIRNGLFPNFNVGVDINNDPHPFIPYDNPVNAGLYIFTLDSLTADPWLNPYPGLFGSRQPTTWANNHGHFPFWTNSASWRERAVNFLRDTIPSGNYVILYTIQYANTSYAPEQWANDSLIYGTNLFQVLEAQGARLIRSTTSLGPRPYILVYKKDEPGFQTIEQLGTLEEPLAQTVYIQGRWDRGEVHSPPIGPAQQWNTLSWRLEESTAEDIWRLDLFGIRADSSEVLLMPSITAFDTTLSHVDATEFPRLRLRFRTTDTTFRSAPQIPYWRVLYTALPDAAIDPASGYRLESDTLMQGAPLRLQLAIRNPGTQPLDSLPVRFTVKNAGGGVPPVEYVFRPLPAGDTLMTSVTLDTRQLRGAQQLAIEVNPTGEQSELYRFNNFGMRNFWVREDERNPLMEVTFDGRRIMDGEIVGARPLIAISLRDENPWLRLRDTALFKVLLKYPGANDVTPVPLDGANVRFIPASAEAGSENRSVLEITPHFTEDGLYTLIAQGQDVSGNQGGALDYRINFEVITASRISNVLNYPNPFSQSTRFVYTLTGEEPPAFFVIRIMTISGRIVRELTQSDLGPLRIGTHQTDFSWDGTDNFGDPLANGVYLYQIIAKDHKGNDFMQYQTAADGFFAGGVGKLVILR